MNNQTPEEYAQSLIEKYKDIYAIAQKDMVHCAIIDIQNTIDFIDRFDPYDERKKEYTFLNKALNHLKSKI